MPSASYLFTAAAVKGRGVTGSPPPGGVSRGIKLLVQPLRYLGGKLRDGAGRVAGEAPGYRLSGATKSRGHRSRR